MKISLRARIRICMSQAAEETGIAQVTWEGLDLRKVWQVLPGAQREPALDSAFKEGTNVFVFKDAYGNIAYAFIDEQGNIRSHGAQSLRTSTIDSLKAAGAMIR